MIALRVPPLCIVTEPLSVAATAQLKRRTPATCLGDWTQRGTFVHLRVAQIPVIALRE